MKLGLVSAREPVAVARAAKPSSSTWETAVRRWLWGRSSAQTAEIEDVAQEVFIRFSRYSDKTLMGCPQTFVLKVAANVVDEWCGMPRDEWPDDEESTEDKQGESRSSVRVNKALAEQLRVAVEKLPPRQRLVLLMHVNESLTYEQIAERLKMTPRIVRRDLARAYAHVRSQVGALELDSISPL